VNIENIKPTMANHIISAEKDEVFYGLDVNNIVLEVPKDKNSPNVWVDVRYNYPKNEAAGLNAKKDRIKIQTSELMSFGINRWEGKETSPAKMSFSMINRRLREDVRKGKEPTEEEQIDMEVEDETVDIIEKITEKIKSEMKKPEFIRAMGKKDGGKDLVKWNSAVDEIELIKRKEQDNGIDAVYLNVKIIEKENFAKTKFFVLDDNEEDGLRFIEQKKIIPKLTGTNCKVTPLLVIDSIFFLNKKPFLLIKAGDVIINSLINNSKKYSIHVHKRVKRGSQIDSKSFDSDNETSAIADSDSDSDSD
ncbi:hypothetical protein, partial [Shrimp hemocyte iridescent virus]